MFNYTHQTHSRAKSIKIKILPGGEIRVTSPKYYPKKLIQIFVKQNEGWIKTQLNKISKQKNFAVSDTEILIFGNKYNQKILKDIKNKIIIKEKNILINLIKPSKPQKNKILERFLKKTASEYLIPRTHQLAKKMNLKFGKITLKQQQSRWGSCSSKGNLNFNWRLVHAPTQVIDYVIIHELAHLKHMNHSAKFWALVAKYDPNYPKHRQWLKNMIRFN